MSSGNHPRSAATGMVVFGYILAVLLPIAGLVLGIVVISQGPRNHGIGIVALSIVIGTVSYMLLF